MKKRFLVWMALFVFVAIVMLSAVIALLLNRSSRAIESAALRQEISYINSAVAERQNEMLRRAKDWAWWEDAYNFMISHNQTFVSNNLDGTMFRTNELNFVVYMDKSGQVVYKRGYDYVNGRDIEFPQELLKMLSPRTIQANANSDGTINGIVKTPSGSMVIAICPVKRNAVPSDSPGWLIFASYMSSKYLSEIDSLRNVSVESTDLSFLQLLNGKGLDISVKSGNSELIVPDISGSVVQGYLVVRDIYGNPIMGARLTFNGDMRSRTNAMTGYIMIVLFAAAILIPLLVVAYMNKVLNWFIGE